MRILLPHTPALDRRGFTLLELLLALVIVTILLVALTPSLIGTITGGRAARLLRDFQAITEAATRFYEDTGFWPSEVTASNDAALTALEDPSVITNSDAASRWQGPYMQVKLSTLGTPFELAGSTDGWPWVDVLVSTGSVRQEIAEAINTKEDGDTLGFCQCLSGGRIQFDGSTVFYVGVIK